MTSKFQSRLPYGLVVIVVLFLDRWTKWLVVTRMFLNQTILVIDGFFNITYVRNTGVAFGILDPVQSSVKSSVLLVLTVAAVTAVIVYSWRTPVSRKLLQVGLSLILAGALGNLYDRLNYGFVVDFIEVYFRNFRWPSFNIADSAITTGVALLALELFRKDTHESPGWA